jgi:hypothetical protein
MLAAGCVVTAGVHAPAASAPHAGSAVSLSKAKQREIYLDVNGRSPSEVAPPGFKAAVGAIVPRDIKLKPLPAEVVKQDAALKAYDYAVVYYYAMTTDEVLIVDPESRKIVAVVTP